MISNAWIITAALALGLLLAWGFTGGRWICGAHHRHGFSRFSKLWHVLRYARESSPCEKAVVGDE